MKKYLVIGSFRHWDGFVHVYDTIETEFEVGSKEFQTQILEKVFDLTGGDDFFEDKIYEDPSDAPDIEFYELVGDRQSLPDSFGKEFVSISEADFKEQCAKAEANRKKMDELRDKEEYERLKEKFECGN